MRTPVPTNPGVWRRLRRHSGPALWAIASVAFLLASFRLGGTGLWQGFLLATPFLIATAGLGWRAALWLTPLALLIQWSGQHLGGPAASAADYLLLLAGLVLATLAGDRLYRAWRRVERSARRAGRRAKLLQEATVELNLAADQGELLRAVPRLLADILPFAHGAVFVPEGAGLAVHSAWRLRLEPGYLVPLGSIMGRAFLTREPQYAPDTALDPDFIQAPDAEATRSELALPVVVGEHVRAIVNLEHAEPHAFGRADQAALAAFVRMIGEVLTRLDATAALTQNISDQQFMARLQHRLLIAETVAETAEAALDEVMAKFDFDVGAVLELHHARLRTVAVRGSPPPELASRVRDGFAFAGILRHAWESRELVLADDLTAGGDWGNGTEARAVAALPIVDPTGQVLALLAVTRYREPLPRWDGRSRQLLASLSAPLGATLARCTLNRQLFATLDAIRQLKSADGPEVLYHRAAQAAFDLVPNAEAVSILVRHGEHYHFEAAIGYDLGFLQAEAGPFTYEENLAWYHGELEDFEAGHGRILRGAEILPLSSQATQSPAATKEGRVAEMRCQLAVPIVDQGQVVALLNIDNFSSDDAFGQGALRIAEAFAQHVTVVVRQAEQVVALERSAVTDALTGLGNREGFERALKQELARARRYEHHLSLVLIDLNGFKQINDRFGHAEGDVVLQDVARAIRGTARGTDQVFRWGGDEFAVVLPEVKPHEAAAAGARIAGVIGALSCKGMNLSASYGVANYPVDGLDRDALLESADHKMYKDKRAQAGAQAQAAPPASSPAEPVSSAEGSLGAAPANAGRVSR